ncbi:MAG: bifunctional phosphopantothenoylcysteine decarboxylase/phosphopantothenate--cysteine ligase CoaBC [Synergistaceae bacterium]|jgi:phosphopantothenoylcysteine decarboxylase/phosphopantothenate--cysteine ligase|nr:bifunctional phosphopantothenoylcysteine decarboxylase/phosphopantothenate--cysteine ligase CoaBC [Synergistaceae bacterium]
MPPQWARDKKILLGVSGGIAAYKTPELVRAWLKQGCEVEVVLTDMGASLVSPLALATLIKRRVWRDKDLKSDDMGWTIPHISLSAWADALVVAPCTANVLRMAAAGDSSTLLGAVMLACEAPQIFFPAMNSRMWAHPATKTNAAALMSRGHRVVDPDSGPLACGYEGKGRLPSAEAILDETWYSLRADKDYAGRKVLVTAGPTREYVDPVRYMSNPSSGKTGYAIASEARYRGADVTLVSGPAHLRVPSGVTFIAAESARDMHDACMSALPDSDVIIKTAAVSDYRVKQFSPQKIKRGAASGASLTLELEQNPDIAFEIGHRKRPSQILVGFAAETQNVRENAISKIERKNLDLVAANDVATPGSGFASDFNSVEVFFAQQYGMTPRTFSGGKWEVASGILDSIAAILPGR